MKMLDIIVVEDGWPALGEIPGSAGCNILTSISPKSDVVAVVRALTPDLVLFDIRSPNEKTLDIISKIQKAVPTPVVIFSQDDTAETIEYAIKVGVNAYVVDAMQAKRIRPILDTAVVRFRQNLKLQQELEKTRNQLSERKLIERAKGIVMEQRNLSEEEAYHLLRNSAMKQNRRLADIAENILSAADLLKMP